MATKTTSRFRRMLSFVGVTLVLVGLVLIGFSVFFPNQAEKAAGDARIFAGQVAMAARGQEHPIVTLGERGTKATLDRCDGTFTEMGAYEMDGLQPVYAAHNICKGEVILPLEVGDLVEIDGQGLYQIMTERHTKKTWSTTDEILGMDGDIILQSCYYGENRMKFISLSPVDENGDLVEQVTTASE